MLHKITTYSYLIKLLFLGLFLFSCDFSRIQISDFRIERSSWEEGKIYVYFTEKKFFGKKRDVIPDSINVKIENGSGDIVFNEEFFSYSDIKFNIDDKILGDEERLNIIVCGQFNKKGKEICGYKTIFASPKKYVLSYRLEYPYKNLFYFKMESELKGKRKKYDSEEYETIFEGVKPNGKITLYPKGFQLNAINFDIENGYSYQDLSILPNFKSFYSSLAKELKVKDKVILIGDISLKINNQNIYFTLEKTIYSPPTFTFDYTKDVECKETEFRVKNFTFDTLIVECKAGYFSYKCDDEHRDIYRFKLLPMEEKEFKLSYDLCFKVTEGKTMAGFLGFFLGMGAGAAVSNDPNAPLVGGVGGAAAAVSAQACNSGKKKVDAYCTIKERISIIDENFK